MSQNTIDRLSSSDSTKIASVVETAFKACAAGGRPSHEVAKAASESGLTLDQTKRACEALNVVMNLSHLKSNSGEKRADSFEIADPCKVAKIMFPDGLADAPKPSAEKQAFSGNEYDLGSYNDGIQAPEAQTFPSLHPMTFDSVYKRISGMVQKAACLKEQNQSAYDGLLLGIESNLRKMAGLTESIYGPSVAGISDEVLRGAVSSLVTKAASQRQPASNSELDVLVVETQAMMKAAYDLGEAVDRISGMIDDFTKSAELGINDLMAPDGANLYRPLMGLPMSDPFVNAFTRSVASSRAPKVLENFDYNPYNDPNLRQVVKTRDILKHVVTLNRLMKEDEVLSKAEPKAVIDAYNSLFSTMPSLFESPELARAALRYQVEYPGGMDFQTMISAMSSSEKLPDSTKLVNRLADEYGTKAKDNKSRFADQLSAARKSDADRTAARRQSDMAERQRLIAERTRKSERAEDNQIKGFEASDAASLKNDRLNNTKRVLEATGIGKNIPGGIDPKLESIQKALEAVQAKAISHASQQPTTTVTT